MVRGNNIETEEIQAYAPVAIAGLGWLPDTILSRSVIVRMRRRHAGESVEPYRRRVHEGQGYAIRSKLASWARSATFEWPTLPDEIQDRDADVWEPLIAIADAVGGQWPSKARVAAVALVSESREAEASLGVRLLADLQTIFEGQHELPSKTILGRLLELPEVSLGRSTRGKPLDERALAKRLRAYGVKPKTIRTNTGTPRGYSKADLEDQWRRYLPTRLDKSKTSKTSETLLERRVADVADVLEFSANGGDAAFSGHKCDHCGKLGQTLECHYGSATTWLHRECQDDWRTEYDKRGDGLEIPGFLDRRNVQ